MSRMPKKIVRVVLIGALLTASSVAAIAHTRTGGGATQIVECTAAGSLVVTPLTASNTWAWGISGSGSCLNSSLPAQATYQLAFSGSGTSTGLGLCSAPGNLPVVQNLNLSMSLQFTNTSTNAVITKKLTWGAPLTTFPEATPFLIESNGSINGLEGLGALETHIFGVCPPAGQPSTAVQFAQTL